MTRPKPSPARALKQLAAAHSAADDERFSIGHAAALLAMLGDAISTPHQERDDMQGQEQGLCVEYLGRQIARHAQDLGAQLEKIERALMAMTGGAPIDPEPEGQPMPHNVVQLNPDDAA